MKVVVVGAGVAGLTSAYALARDGHEVTIVERDDTPMPPSADDAFTRWARRGAPQVRHSHAFLARLRNLLRDRAPDLLAALLEAGAYEIEFTRTPPPAMTDWVSESADSELVALACRRTTFEWVLRRRVLAVPHVTLRDGVTVVGLSAEAGPDHRPLVVRGVEAATADGRSVTFDGDLVVDAGGPRGGGVEWFAAHGVAVEQEASDCGIVYLSRFYRVVPGATTPVLSGPLAGDIGCCKYALFLGDNGTFSVTLAVSGNDGALRMCAREDAFEAVIRLMPDIEPWVGRDVSLPITGVHVMAGLRNRHRRFVDDDRPLSVGFVAVGDASVATNPLYGRGCSLAAVHAFALADCLASLGTDARPGRDLELVQAFEEATARELVPWYTMACIQDEQAREAARNGDRSATDGAGAAADTRALLASVMRDGLLPALRTDPVVFRAFLRWFNLLSPPNALLTDPDVTARVMAVWSSRDGRPEEVVGPGRDALIAAIADATGGDVDVSGRAEA